MVKVDGVQVKAPASFSWEQGSVHTIGTEQTQLANDGSRYLFVKWSNGTVPAYSYTVPTAAAALTATFQQQFQLKASANNPALGSVKMTPAASDTGELESV